MGVAERRGVSQSVGWRIVTARDIRKEGGSGLLQQFNGSLHAALADAFANDGEGEWSVSECRRVLPRDHWMDEENVRAFLVKVREEYDMQSSEDWMRLSKKQMRALNGAGLLNYMSLQEALHVAFPGERWQSQDTQKTSVGKKSAQRELMVSVSRLFLTQRESV